MAARRDGEFTNDGKFIRKVEQPKDAPYGYDLAIKPGLNRMVSSSFTHAAKLQEAAGGDGPQGFRRRDESSGTSRHGKPLQVGKRLAPGECAGA